MPLHSAVETRQVAVRVTESGADPHEEKLDGLAERSTLEVLTFAINVTTAALGLHVKESCPIPALPAEKVIARGLTLQVA